MDKPDGMHKEADDAKGADDESVTHTYADASEEAKQISKKAACEQHDDGKNATDGSNDDTALQDASAAEDGTVTGESIGSADAKDAEEASESNQEDKDEPMGSPAGNADQDDANGTTATDVDDGTAAVSNDNYNDDTDPSSDETSEGTQDQADDIIEKTAVMPSPADGTDDDKCCNDATQAQDEDNTASTNDGNKPGKAAKDIHPSKRKRVIATVCGIAVAAITAGCLYVGHETASALSETSSAISSAAITDDNTNGVLDRTASFTDLTDEDIMPDDGGDDGILAAYATARDAAGTAVAEEMPSVDGIEWYELDEARSTRDDAERIASEKHDALSTLRAAASAITTSKYERQCSDAKDALQSSSDSAQDVLDSTEDEVHDNAIRQTLADAIDAGNALLGEDKLLSADVYSSTQKRIDDASQAVSDDHAQWQKEKEEEEERQRQAAAAAAAAKAYSSQEAAESAASASGGNAVQSSDGTWYVSYRGNDREGTANADGSVSEYRDGYFIAHRSGSNGAIIATRPSSVVVDGKSYHYVSSIVVDDDSAFADAYAYARQNGGIGFQTCTIPTGGDIIVHYEPDN